MNRNLLNRIRRIKNIVRFGYLHLVSHGRLVAMKNQYSSGRSMYKMFGGSIFLGQRCCIEEGTLLQTSNGHIQLGTDVYINRNCTIVSHENIIIGEHTTIGPNVCIYDHDHNYRAPELGVISTPVVIGKGVWIGAGSIILRGTKIGDNCVIAAGSVVKGEIPAATVVVCKHEMIIKPIKK